MLSVVAPTTTTEKSPYVLADAFDIFSPLPSLPLLFPKQLLHGLTVTLTFGLFSAFFFPSAMSCLDVRSVLVLFSDLAVFLWCWRLCVSEGAQITVLIFIFEDIAFLIGEAFNFVSLFGHFSLYILKQP